MRSVRFVCGLVGRSLIGSATSRLERARQANTNSNSDHLNTADLPGGLSSLYLQLSRHINCKFACSEEARIRSGRSLYDFFSDYYDLAAMSQLTQVNFMSSQSVSQSVVLKENCYLSRCCCICRIAYYHDECLVAVSYSIAASLSAASLAGNSNQRLSKSENEPASRSLA